MGKSAIISGQKPARRKRRHAEANRKKLAFAALRFAGVVAIVAFALMLPGYVVSRIQHGFKWLVSSQSIQIEFLGSGGNLADFDRDVLQARISEAASAGKNLDDIARLAGGLAPLSRVEVIRSSPGKILVSFARREPALRIERGIQKLVDNAGFIYGSCCSLPAQEAESRLPLLTGIPGSQVDGGMTAKEEEGLLREALALNSGLLARGIRASTIRHQAHRGFFAIMDPEGIEVAMGLAPFDDKLGRLTEVLQRVDRTKVSRIELDYHGKAFIKERKL